MIFLHNLSLTFIGVDFSRSVLLGHRLYHSLWLKQQQVLSDTDEALRTHRFFPEVALGSLVTTGINCLFNLTSIFLLWPYSGGLVTVLLTLNVLIICATGATVSSYSSRDTTVFRAHKQETSQIPIINQSIIFKELG